MLQEQARLEAANRRMVELDAQAATLLGAPLPSRPASLGDLFGNDLSPEGYYDGALHLNIVGGTPESAIAEHARAFDSWRLTGQEYFNQFRGSVLGDLFANAGTIANNGGLTAIQGLSSLVDLATDRASDIEVLTGVAQAIIHPVRT